MFSFRQMLEADLDAVLQIEAKVFTSPWPRVAFESSNAEESFVLCVDNLVVGYIMFLSALNECSIINVAVDPQYQGRGYATMMFNEVFAHNLGKHKIDHYYLDVRLSNLAAIGLYEKLGFTRLAVRKSYYSLPDEDALVMFLDLKASAWWKSHKDERL